uniref:PH01B001G05.25 protein n=1 Tax=Phyllostachys edulis TaxID=38705 RepID=L0P2D0_PHYED|nr:PH01B001G05.25 [Phyllostachys edulis]
MTLLQSSYPKSNRSRGAPEHAREHGVVPDCVENNVGDRVHGAIAVASLEEAAVVTQAQQRKSSLGSRGRGRSLLTSSEVTRCYEPIG